VLGLAVLNGKGAGRQEQLAADQVYEFAYFLTTNAIRGTVAGTALRPVAMR
jgi:hypothetical protein